MRKRTSYIEEVNGVECECTWEACYSDEIVKRQVGDKYVVGYITYDHDCQGVEDLMGDCMGQMYSFHRHSNNAAEGLEALGNDSDGEANLDAVWDKHWEEATKRYVKQVLHDCSPDEVIEQFDEDPCDMPEALGVARDLLISDANGVSGWANVMFESTMQSTLAEMWGEPAYFPGDKDAQTLDCYSHSGEHWSLSGGGMQCRFDTARCAGVWVPDTCLREQLDSDEAKGLDRSDQASMYCKQFLNTFNEINSGQVFGVVVEWFDEDGTLIENDHCWGYVGSDHAAEALKENFESQCESLQKTYEEELRTQSGAQLELEMGD